MRNGNAPVAGVLIVALALLAAALLLFQPYTADWPGTDYGKAVRRYLRTAIRQDSLSLAELSTSSAPVRWALGAARHRPRTLALWGGRVETFVGPHRGDTAEVFVYPLGRTCEHAPIVLRVVGMGDGMRVMAAESACLP
ncbi:MAG TPA: hypothetical protein VEB59_00020 [Gemmatimonadales bacterium]|nr:hypothetical protein [Gemmatimonadales bacterium]